MKYLNKSKKDVQMNLPNTVPVEWVVVKKGESKEIDVSAHYAARFGLFSEDKLKELAKEKKAKEDEQEEAESSSIGHKKVETKKLKKKSKSGKKKSKKSKA